MTIYDHYGTTVRTSSIVNNTVMYTGRRLDPETGLYYFRNRYYSADLGRFVSRDPLGYVDGMSMYAGYYVPNGVDPSGLSKKGCDSLMNVINDIQAEIDRLREKIANINRNIERRNRDMVNDPQNLPKKHPLEGINPSLSKDGHRDLIAKDVANRRRLEYELSFWEKRQRSAQERYDDKCKGKAPPLSPCPVPVSCAGMVGSSGYVDPHSVKNITDASKLNALLEAWEEKVRWGGKNKGEWCEMWARRPIEILTDAMKDWGDYVKYGPPHWEDGGEVYMPPVNEIKQPGRLPGRAPTPTRIPVRVPVAPPVFVP